MLHTLTHTQHASHSMKLSSLIGLCALAAGDAARRTYNLDPSWRFQVTSDRAPTRGSPCSLAGCQPSTPDNAWRVVDLPHDYQVEQNFSGNADGGHGYLPFVSAWYRRHIAIPGNVAGTTVWIDFEGIQTQSYVYLNGHFIGSSVSGYTNSRYFLGADVLLPGADNVLAVYVDGTHYNSWW